MTLHTHDTVREVATAPPNSSTQSTEPVRSNFEVAVSLAQETPHQRTLKTSIAAWIFPPRKAPAKRTVSFWYLGIPGATYRGLSYFDRQVSGYGPEEFSIARYLAKQGIGLVIIDMFGTGESKVEVDGEQITRHVTAQANAQVLHQLRSRLVAGTLAPGLKAVPEDAIFLGGFGHSMGAFQLTQLAALLEDRGTPLDAAIFAGWSHGLVDYERLGLDANALLAGMTTTNGYYTVPRRLMRPVFYGPQPTVPTELIEADEREAIAFPKGLLDEGLIPGIVAQEASRLSRPVLYVATEHDFSACAQAEGEVFRSTRLYTAYTQPQAAHCNFEASRQEFWRVVAWWTHMVAALKFPFHLLPNGGLS